MKHIRAFFHCAKCLAEKPADISPQAFAAIDCGWTERGFQVWCLRHDINIVHVDFEGVKHLADMSPSGDFNPRSKQGTH